MQLVIGAFLTLTMISSCDTFEDEMTPDSYSETIKHVDGIIGDCLPFPEMG